MDRQANPVGSDENNPKRTLRGHCDLVCKINNAHMYVSGVGEIPCGSKEDAIAVLCDMLRRVSQF